MQESLSANSERAKCIGRGTGAGPREHVRAGGKRDARERVNAARTQSRQFAAKYIAGGDYERVSAAGQFLPLDTHASLDAQCPGALDFHPRTKPNGSIS